MTTITVQLPDDQADRLARMAERFHISVEQLATAGVQELLSERDDQFRQAVTRILEKNAELYRRLA